MKTLSTGVKTTQTLINGVWVVKVYAPNEKPKKQKTW